MFPLQQSQLEEHHLLKFSPLQVLHLCLQNQCAAQEKEGLGAPHCSGKYSFLCIPESFLSGQNWCLKCAKPLTVTIIVWWVSRRANNNNIPLCLWNSLWTNKLITTVWIPHFLPPEIKSVLCQAVVYSKIWHLSLVPPRYLKWKIMQCRCPCWLETVK